MTTHDRRDQIYEPACTKLADALFSHFDEEEEVKILKQDRDLKILIIITQAQNTRSVPLLINTHLKRKMERISFGGSLIMEMFKLNVCLDVCLCYDDNDGDDRKANDKRILNSSLLCAADGN